MTDPIADFLTRIRNAVKAGHKVVDIPGSKMKRDQFCRPVGAAGGGLFCPVPHCGDGGFCGRHHPKRDDLKWLSRRR